MESSPTPSTPESLSCGSTAPSTSSSSQLPLPSPLFAIPSTSSPPSAASLSMSQHHHHPQTKKQLSADTVPTPPPLISINSAPPTVKQLERRSRDYDHATAQDVAWYAQEESSSGGEDARGTITRKKRSSTVSGYDHAPQPFFPSSSFDTHSRVASPTTISFPGMPAASGSTSSHQPLSDLLSTYTTLAEMNEAVAGPTRRRKQTSKYGAGQGGGSEANHLEAKIVILGSQGVGKTSIVNRYTTGHFSHTMSSTIGASFLIKKLVIDDCRVRLQIWDTAGQERFRSMAPLYYRQALAATIVYDITDMKSFLDVRMWLEELRARMSPDLIIYVVGSKCDLASQRQVSLEFARAQVAEWYYEGMAADEDRYAASPRSTQTAHQTRSTSPPSPTLQGRSRSTTSAAVLVRSSTTPNFRDGRSRGATLTNPATSSNMMMSGSTSSMNLSSALTAPVIESESMSRTSSTSTTSKLGLVGSLAMVRRKSAEDEERRRRNELELEQQRKKQSMIDHCPVTVAEVSAKDDEGIEDMFLSIASKLVERKARIESDRVLRSRDSVMLHEQAQRGAPAGSTASASWCC